MSMRRAFRIAKNIRKGLKGAALSGGAAAATLVSTGEGLDDVEEKVIALIAALLGYAFEALKNWIKNRDK